MDNQATESSNSPLDTNQAAAVFAEMLEPRKEEEAAEPQAAEAEETPEAEAVEADVEAESQEEPQTFTIKVDGKEVEVTLDELKNGYQRQSDYTRKTMEAAEQRKAAEAEYQKARSERDQYAQKLNSDSALLTALISEQQQTNWQQLLESDPVEYLKQQHLYQQRYAQLQQVQQEQQKVWELQQSEQARQFQGHLKSQHDLLLEKLPDWKDEAKAKTEKAELKTWLSGEGFSEAEINSLADAKFVIAARKAMLYDKMISQAKAAAKKVQNAPQRVERPSTGNAPSLDKRSSAYQRLSKSGKVEDAAAVFASLL